MPTPATAEEVRGILERALFLDSVDARRVAALLEKPEVHMAQLHGVPVMYGQPRQIDRLLDRLRAFRLQVPKRRY